MKRAFENKLSMYLAVQQVCADNNAVWSGVGAVSAAITEFNNTITAITAARQIQENSHTGLTEDKKLKQEAMANVAMVVKGAVQAYATDSRNNELYESVNYSNSAIKKQPDTIARDRALLIYNKAMSVNTVLGNYGVNSTVLTSLQSAITDFEAIMSRPRTAINSVKASTLQISELFANADIVLKRRIDKLMLQFSISSPAFYNTFTNARQIVDSGKGSKTLEAFLNAGEVKTVHRVINGSTLTNTGSTALRYCADRLPPCDAGDESAIIIQPGDSIEVDIKKSYVTLTNTDTASKGSFKVKVTSTVPVAAEAVAAGAGH
ncbi:MAG: hypothetical protein JWO09_973 [Bacteroidetes bacterium]|nr:hypothetical protein [Bacteroidota bacterium]